MDLRLPERMLSPVLSLPTTRPRLFWALCAGGTVLVFVATAARLPIALAAAAAVAVLLVATGIRQPEATRWAALVALFAVPIASAFPLLQSQNYNYDAYLVGFAGLVAAVVVVSRRAVAGESRRRLSDLRPYQCIRIRGARSPDLFIPDIHLPDRRVVALFAHDHVTGICPAADRAVVPSLFGGGSWSRDRPVADWLAGALQSAPFRVESESSGLHP